MNLLELRDAARIELDDLAAGSNASDLLWSDAELDRFINEAVTEAVRRGMNIRDDGVTINATVGVNQYALPSNVLQLHRIRVQGSPLMALVQRVEEDIEYLRWGVQAGEPRQFALAGNTIIFDKSPNTTMVFSLSVYRLPKPLNLDTDTPELPSQYHEPLLHWVRHRAYAKQDAETNNIELSDKGARLFERHFGARRSAAAEVVLRSKQPRRSRASFF